MKKIKIKKDEKYFDIDSVKVVVTETIEQPTINKETVYTRRMIKETIAFLKNKKQEFNDQIDSEIDYNKELLKEVEENTKNVVLDVMEKK